MIVHEPRREVILMVRIVVVVVAMSGGVSNVVNAVMIMTLGLLAAGEM